MKHLSIRGRVFLLSVATAILHATTMRAQGMPGADSSWGFVTARYDARSGGSITTGYGWGVAFAMLGMSYDPRSEYAELSGGIGAVLKAGAHAEHWLAVAAARAADVSSAQLYWLPTVRAEAITVRAVVKASVAYQGGTMQKISVSPLSISVPIAMRLAAGPAVEFVAARGAPTSAGAGLEVRLSLPRAVVGITAVQDFTARRSRVRLNFGSRP